MSISFISLRSTSLIEKFSKFFSSPTYLVALVSIQYFGFFFDDNVFYFCTAAIYIKYLIEFEATNRSNANLFLLRCFLLIVVTLFLINANRIFSLEFLEFNNRDWKLVITPLVCVMIIDSFYSLSKIHNLRISQLANWALIAILAGTVSYILVLPEFEFPKLIALSDARPSGLVTRNVNMADDVYFFLICSIVGFSLFSDLKLRWRILLLVALVPFLAYFALMIVQGQSRGGWLGIAAGSVFTVFYCAVLKRFAPVVILSGVVAALFLVQGDLLVGRINYESDTRAAILDQILNEGKLDFDKVENLGDPPTRTRLLALKNGWDLISVHPYVGHGTFDAEAMAHLVSYPKNLVSEVHLHNLFLDITVRQGPLFLLIYFGLILGPIVFLIYTSYRHRRDTRYFYFCAIFLVFAIYLFVENLTNLTFVRSDPGVRIQYILMSIYGLILYQNYVRARHAPNKIRA